MKWKATRNFEERRRLLPEKNRSPSDVKLKKQKNKKKESLPEGLNDDCLSNMLSHLVSEDLDSVGMCSQRLCNMRHNDPLDQTRTGTIVCTEGNTIRSLLKRIKKEEMEKVFSGNRKRLKLVGIGDLSHPNTTDISKKLFNRARLDGVINP